jgi:hypothetical protein
MVEVRVLARELFALSLYLNTFHPLWIQIGLNHCKIFSLILIVSRMRFTKSIALLQQVLLYGFHLFVIVMFMVGLEFLFETLKFSRWGNGALCTVGGTVLAYHLFEHYRIKAHETNNKRE